MKAPVNWSMPAQVWLQFGATACIWHALYLYTSRNVFAGPPAATWISLSFGVGLMMINGTLWFMWRSFHADIRAALQTPMMVDNEARFHQYMAFREGKASLPKQRPMTRHEYISYLQEQYPKACTAYARMGLQLQRPRILQYIDPFFIFKTEQDRLEAVHRYFDFLHLYCTEYPEYDTSSK